MDGLSTDEATATGISTIADTWIHLSYVVQDGERNRALTIVKSRGTGHSNQVRELTLSNDGVTLTDVFVAQGKVLMGVARWEWEQEELAAQERTKVAAELKRLQLQLAQAEAAARLQVVQTEMEARSAEIVGPGGRHRVGVQAAEDRPRGAAQDAARRRGDPSGTRTRREGRSAEERNRPAERASVASVGTRARARLRLRLYVAGNAPNSVRAIANARRSATSTSPRVHELEIVDLLEHPKRALADGIIVTPTLLKLLPLPVQRVIGNLSDTKPGAPGAGEPMNASEELRVAGPRAAARRGRSDDRGAALRPDRRRRRCQEPDAGAARQGPGCAAQERDRAQRYLDTPDVILLALDLDGRITLVNRYACSILGWTADELIGRNWIETCLPAPHARHTDGQASCGDRRPFDRPRKSDPHQVW